MILCNFYLAAAVLPFHILGAYREDHLNNSSATASSNTAPTLESFGKRINEVLNSIEPGQDNGIGYFDIFDVVHKYLPVVDKMSSNEEITMKMYGLLRRGNLTQVRRMVETEFESEDPDEILHSIPSTLTKRAEKIYFDRYPKVNSSNQKNNIMEIIDIACVNVHNVEFAIRTKYGNHSAQFLARDGLIELLLWCDSGLKQNYAEQWEKWKIVKPRETVYIGVACNVIDKTFCMSFYNPTTDHEPSYVAS